MQTSGDTEFCGALFADVSRRVHSLTLWVQTVNRHIPTSVTHLISTLQQIIGQQGSKLFTQIN